VQRLSISTRLTLVVSIAAVVVFSAVGSWQLRAEERDLRAAVAHDMRLLGRSLQVAFENALRDAQAEDVQETLRALERIDPQVDVFVYDALGAQVAMSTGAIERAGSLAATPRGTELRFLPERAPGRVELATPLVITRDERPATLVVVRPLDEMQNDLAATRWRVVLSLGGFVLLVAVVTNVLSRLWVGVPLARMIRHMKRVREGDLSPSREPARRDEVGETLRQFEVLVRELADARARLETEAEARRHLEEKLREVDKLATVGQLAAGLAHEIGSPLQILEGRIAGLESKTADLETRRVARILLEQARRITRIVSRLTGIARRRAEISAACHVVGPVSTVVDLLEGEARRRGIVLGFTSEDGVLPIEADADSIQQVALNLVRNALEATPRGGRVAVRVERASIDRADHRVREAIRISVRDTGRGMDRETRERAFDAFYTTRAAEGGTGLGLAVVKGIVDDYGGRIDVRSALGEGTTFAVDIPVAQEEMEPTDDARA
jgi:signal transduction histidine kinase